MMGNTSWGLGIRLLFICIFLLTLPHTCLTGRNLTTTVCSEQERLALLKFKHSVRDDHGMLSSWGVGTDCCKWERVGCDDATGRVVSLHLRKIDQLEYMYVEQKYFGIDEDEYLVGDELNSCLIELVNLKHLDLSGNDFQQSRILEFIGSLKQLRYLNLSDTGFSGNIPHQIGNLSNLKVLDLSSQGGDTQDLMIDDMAWISGLLKLEQLHLSGVDLSTTQNLHNLLYLIPRLSKLSLSYCGLCMAHLPHLNSSREPPSIKHLDLSENDFRGQLPGLFLNMTSLAFLDLSCHYSTPVSMAWSFGNLLSMIPSVSELHLSECGLQKVNISPTNLNFSTCSNIQHLDLSWNDQKEGKFPSILTNMSSLLSLDMSRNWLNSSIPDMPNLVKLDISGNDLRHIEDVGIWRQCHLKELIGSHNLLQGEIIGPSTNVSKCSQNALEILYLDDNILNSVIPKSLGRLTNLRGLDLSSNELTGRIPEALAKLRSLQGLYLSFNELTGPIPEDLAKLRSLQGLDLSFNHLIGPIPEFHEQLTRLDLGYNKLNGSLPESLGRLTSLREMLLESNQFTGPIPVFLGRQFSLRVLSIYSNFLNGTIPISIGQLTKLLVLDVSQNYLHGVVSEQHFANLSKMKYLDAGDNNKLIFNISREWIPPFQLNVLRLGSCKIQDGFPRWLRTQMVLSKLTLSNASIYGPLPIWLRLMPKIKFVDLSYNKLTGPLTNLPPSVMTLHLQHNLFRGLIPRWLCTSADLNIVNLSGNMLSGKIPTCMWNLSLQAMLLSSNRLSGFGVMPSSVSGRDPSLEWLQLNDNNFNGELPQEFGYFKKLVVLDLGENKVSGNIPEWIGENLSDLFAVRLHKNNFTGQIPHSLCKSDSLHILDLAHNNLTGSVPRCFTELDGMKDNGSSDMLVLLGYGSIREILNGIAREYTNTLRFMINMDLSSNKLTGEIPETITALDALMGLNLCNNNFTGAIPKNIGNMRSLISLDLSVNELSGMIPPSMAALNFLSYMNLSHNNLSGQIPTGNQLQTLTDDPSIYADNPYLCGAPLPKECSPHKNTSKNKYENASEPKKVWFYLDITCGFATGFWGIIGVLLLKKEWRHKLFMFSEETVDKIYVAVVVRVLKIKRGCMQIL